MTSRTQLLRIDLEIELRLALGVVDRLVRLDRSTLRSVRLGRHTDDAPVERHVLFGRDICHDPPRRHPAPVQHFGLEIIAHARYDRLVHQGFCNRPSWFPQNVFREYLWCQPGRQDARSEGRQLLQMLRFIEDELQGAEVAGIVEVQLATRMFNYESGVFRGCPEPTARHPVRDV